MINSRSKGRRIEQDFARSLRTIFPRISRNWAEQAAHGGVDFVGTDPFDLEAKGGKQCAVPAVLSWLAQVEREGRPEHYKAVLCKPDRLPAYVIMPLTDWMEIVGAYLRETQG